MWITVFLAGVFLLLVGPLLVIACQVALRSPWFGVALALLALLGAGQLVPHTMPRLDTALLSVIVGAGTLIGLFALAGFARVPRKQSPCAPLPRARVIR